MVDEGIIMEVSSKLWNEVLVSGQQCNWLVDSPKQGFNFDDSKKGKRLITRSSLSLFLPYSNIACPKWKKKALPKEESIALSPVKKNS